MTQAVAAVQAARDDPAYVVVEGFHAVKHALRFGAELELLVSPDPQTLLELADELAPDVGGALSDMVVAVDADTWQALGSGSLPTPALAVARRPTPTDNGPVAGPAVLLEDPRHLGNLGACVRVAAAAGAHGVFTTGDADPWHPSAVRASAGLHFAVHVERLDPERRPPTSALVAIDPGGAPLGAAQMPDRPVFAFGTERHGLSEELRTRAAATVAIPMRPGVSSLNLATAVAVVLYAHRGLGP